MNYMPRARNSDECPQHHVPPGECPPWSRHPHTIRIEDRLFRGAQKAGGSGEVAGWIEETMEVRLGEIRCLRCPDGAPPVPLICGDLTGGTVDGYLRKAQKRVRAQHPRHEPVWLGAEPSAPAPVVFMPPMPAVVPDHGGKKGRVRAQ